MIWLFNLALLVLSVAAISYGAYGDHEGSLGLVGVAWMMVGIYGLGAWTAVVLGQVVEWASPWT